MSGKNQHSFAHWKSFEESSEILVTLGLECRDDDLPQPYPVPQAYTNILRLSTIQLNAIWTFTDTLVNRCLHEKIYKHARLRKTCTAYFWEAYTNLASEQHIRSSLRSIWRLLQRQDFLTLKSLQSLLFLEYKYRTEPSGSLSAILCRFTGFFVEMIRNLLVRAHVRQKQAPALRNLILKFQSVDFFATPVCKCCLKRVCTAEYFQVAPQQFFPEVPRQPWLTKSYLRVQQQTTAVEQDSCLDTIVRIEEKCCAINHQLEECNARASESRPKGLYGGLLASEIGCRIGWLRRQLVELKLNHATLDALVTLFHEREHKEVQVNDSVVEDFRILSKGFGFSTPEIYRRLGFDAVFKIWKTITRLSDSELSSTLLMESARNFILSSHFKLRSDADTSDHWSFGCQSINDPCGPPVTKAHLIWLDLWSLMKQNIHDSALDLHEKFSPSFLSDPVAEIIPLFALWIRLSFELSAINKMYLTGESSLLEAAATDTAMVIYALNKDAWPTKFKDLLIKRIFRRYLKAEQIDNDNLDPTKAAFLKSVQYKNFSTPTYGPITTQDFLCFNARSLQDRNLPYGATF